MMTEEDIGTELGWDDDMICYLLRAPDSPHARRNKHTGAYSYGLYKCERVLAVAQSTEGRAAKRRRDETLLGNTPNPGWTTRLGDIGRVLDITGRCGEASGATQIPLQWACHRQRGSGLRRWKYRTEIENVGRVIALTAPLAE
jgi:hypothetical protein